MTVLVIGSTAAKRLLPDWREPKDFDALSDIPREQFANLVGQPGDIFWDDRLYAFLGRDEARTATLDELYTIKVSHSYWELKNGSWGKHMADIVKLKQAGAQLLPFLHNTLYGIWEDLHGKKVVDLTQEADEFFADAVKRLYDHDSIHRSVAFDPGRPIYEDCLKDGKTVQMDMGKVWAMPHERIMQMFREEIYVTALERIVIPKNYRTSAGAAYQWALRRTITSLTKGKSAAYLVTHFDEISKPNMDYVKHHLANKHFLEKL